MKSRLLQPLLCILALCLSAGAAMAGTSVETLQVAGETRSYRVHLPARGAGTYPIVFSFHGFNPNAEQEERLSQFSALADREGFIAVYPEGIDARWRFMGRSDADVLLTLAIIDKLAAEIYLVMRGEQSVLCCKLHHENQERCIFNCRYHSGD